MVSDPGLARPPASVCATFWKDFDLMGYRKALDDRGLTVAAAQESSIKSRRQLTDITKNFRKTAEATVVAAVSGLLKSYQEEVDRLTQRAKAGESAFLDVYQRLYEAPDPATALMDGLDASMRVAKAEAAAARAKQELEEFRSEAQDLRNQDLTLRRAEERVRSLEAQLVDKESELAAVTLPPAPAPLGEESAEEFAAREAALESALSEAHLGLENMRRLHLASENRLFTLQRDQEAAAVGDDGEAELAAAEMEEARDRLLALEAEKAALVAQVDGMKSASGQGAALSSSPSATLEQRLRAEVSSQRDIISRLRTEAQAAGAAADEAAAREAETARQLRTQEEAAQARLKDLASQLAARPLVAEVQELRTQIRGLQMVAGLEDDQDGEEDATIGGNNSGGGAGKGKGLEAMLVERTRRCEHDATIARLAAVEAQEELQASVNSELRLQSEVTRLTSLAAQLEEDLAAAVAASDALEPSSTIDDTSTEKNSNRSMVQVLAAQRDRLRERTMQLEDGAAQLGQQLVAAKAQLEAARKDNVALVERLKFVQSFPKEKRNTGGTAAESRYAASYQASVDPFAAWRTRAAEEKRAGMQIHDRFLYSAAQLVAAHPIARALVCVYALVLHLLVFVVLSRAAHQQSAAYHLSEGNSFEQHSILLGQAVGGGGITDPIAGATGPSTLSENSSTASKFASLRGF